MHSSILRELQLRIQEFYALEQAPDIVDFVRFDKDDTREKLLVKQAGEHLELAVVLPEAAQQAETLKSNSDLWLQLVEAVSHFLYLAERARTGLPATQLELELQAEVDKFIVLALIDGAFARQHALALHGSLYERVRFLHPENTEAGARYRLANELAARFIARLVVGRDPRARRSALCRFYRCGQAEKIRLARAA